MTDDGATPRSIVILTGAGISAESGLGTFRDTHGAWAKFDPMELATPEAFARNPTKVHGFYNMRRADLLNAQPNTAHVALARLEKTIAEKGGSVLIVTQNIDDLHERAGAANVLHMHGELLKARCEGAPNACGRIVDWRQDLSIRSQCPACGLVGSVRPHVVWFHEMPLHLDEIDTALSEADLFVSIGTSGTVWPAAGFVMQAKARGVHTLELNLEPSDGGAVFDDGVYGPATQVVPQWVEALCARA